MRIKNYITIILFVFSIYSPYLLWSFLNIYFDTKNYEKRPLAELPQFSLKSIQEYPSLLEKYVNDHLPFRNQFIKFNSIILYYVFNSSINNQVIVGEKGWLFYNVDNTISNYKGVNLIPSSGLLFIKNGIIAIQYFMASRKIDFVIFIAPNRERVYSKYLPYYYNQPADYYKTIQLIEFLKQFQNIKIVFPVNNLINLSNDFKNNIITYYKTDTHWNNLGAYIGTRELLKEFDILLPDYNHNKLRISSNDASPGDLSFLLHLQNVIDHGRQYSVQGYNINVPLIHKYNRFKYINRGKHADQRKIFLNRDSFGTAMLELLSSQFSEIMTVSRSEYNNHMIDEFKPDIYIFEVVERNLIHDIINFMIQINKSQSLTK